MTDSLLPLLFTEPVSYMQMDRRLVVLLIAGFQVALKFLKNPNFFRPP